MHVKYCIMISEFIIVNVNFEMCMLKIENIAEISSNSL
jgi:hypothetical protein